MAESSDIPATLTRLALRGWLLAGFILGLIIFFGLNVASYLTARQSVETARGLRHIHEVVAQIQELRTHAADAQSGMRGYVISGREGFLTPYQNGVLELPNDQRRLRQLLGSNPRQQERLQRLDSLIGELLEIMRATIELRRSRGLEAAVAQVSAGRSHEIMDQIRSVARELEQEERILLAGREAQAGAAASQMFSILPVGTLIGLGLLLLVLFFLNSETGARQQTESANRNYAAIVESTDDAVISKTLTGLITSWNPAAERILGCEAREAVGQPMLRFFPPERASEEADILARIGRGERIENFETVRIRKDGSRLEASVTISPVKDATGRIIGASTILRDISERKRVELAARESEASRAAILASALDCIIAMDRHGRVIDWNPAAERTFGYPREDAMGKPLSDLIVPVRFREAHGRGLARFLEKGEGPLIGKRIEMPALHRAGNEFPVELSIVVSRADDLFFTAYLRDITERKRMELAVRESEERFRTMANSLPQLAWIARADGFIFWYNERWHDYTGTTPQQMEGWGWQSVHDPAVLPKVMAGWTDAIASGKRFDMEFPLRRADGQFRTFLTRVEPVKNAEGRVMQWVGTNTDVEVLKQAEERLRQSEEFNRRIIQSSSDCIKVLDLEARLLSMSEGGQRLLEIQDINRYLNNSWISFWQPEDQPRVREAVEAARAGGMGRFHAFCRTEAGNPRWWDVIVTPIRGASEQVERLLSISRDISAHYQAEEEIRRLNSELEQRVVERTAQLEAANLELVNKRAELTSLFESLPGLYLVLTPDLTIVSASDAYLKATMTTRAGIVGRGLFEVFPGNPADIGATGVAHLRASLDRVRETAAPHTMAILKYDVRRPDGVFEERYWSPINSPVLGADRRMRYLVHRVEDVTDFVKQRAAGGDASVIRARMETMEAEIFQSSQKLQAANQQLEAANRELEAFSYSVSHDLRAPLRAVDGFSQALLEDFGPKLPREGQRHLEVIRGSAQRMGALIDDLLEFSRLGRSPIAKLRINTDELVRAALAELRGQTAGREIDFQIAALPACDGDHALLKQVWINLLSNALKYSGKRARARIEVGAQSGNNEVVFFVRDNGAGFDMRYVDKLFGVFQRLHRVEEYQGTGVGLAIVQRIVERHGGRVWAEGKPDEGAAFYFTLSGRSQT